MKKIALLGMCAAMLMAAEAGAAVLYDSGGFAGYTIGDLDGQNGWTGGVTPGANIGGGIMDLGGVLGLGAYLVHDDANPSAYGVWTHSLAPTTDQFISVNWLQYVDGGTFGVVLYDGATTVASVAIPADAAWHQWQMDVDLSTNQATLFMDSSFVTSFATSGSTSVDSVGLLANTGIGDGFYDNLSVTSVPEPAIAAMGLASAILVLPRRRAAK